MGAMDKWENVLTICPQPANLNLPYVSIHFHGFSHLTENRLTALQRELNFLEKHAEKTKGVQSLAVSVDSSCILHLLALVFKV